MLVYPVPIKGSNVLGVHSTLAISGHVKIGPTVFPAFSPENYENTENITLKGISNMLKTYAYIAKSPKSRGLISLYFTKELRKSVSISTLVA